MSGNFIVGPDESERSSSSDDELNGVHIPNGSPLAPTTTAGIAPSTTEISHAPERPPQIIVNGPSGLSTDGAADQPEEDLVAGPAGDRNGHISLPPLPSGAQTPEHRRNVNPGDTSTDTSRPNTPDTLDRVRVELENLPRLSTDSASHMPWTDSETGLTFPGITRDPQPTGSLSVPEGARAPQNSIADASSSEPQQAQETIATATAPTPINGSSSSSANAGHVNLSAPNGTASTGTASNDLGLNGPTLTGPMLNGPTLNATPAAPQLTVHVNPVSTAPYNTNSMAPDELIDDDTPVPPPRSPLPRRYDMTLPEFRQLTQRVINHLEQQRALQGQEDPEISYREVRRRWPNDFNRCPVIHDNQTFSLSEMQGAFQTLNEPGPRHDGSLNAPTANDTANMRNRPVDGDDVTANPANAYDDRPWWRAPPRGRTLTDDEMQHLLMRLMRHLQHLRAMGYGDDPQITWREVNRLWPGEYNNIQLMNDNNALRLSDMQQDLRELEEQREQTREVDRRTLERNAQRVRLGLARGNRGLPTMPTPEWPSPEVSSEPSANLPTVTTLEDALEDTENPMLDTATRANEAQEVFEHPAQHRPSRGAEVERDLVDPQQLETDMRANFDPSTQRRRAGSGSLNPVLTYDYPSTINPHRYRQIAEEAAEEQRGVSPLSRVRSPPQRATGQEAGYYNETTAFPPTLIPSSSRDRQPSVIQIGGVVEMQDRMTLRRPSQFTPLPHEFLPYRAPAAQPPTANLPITTDRRRSSAPSATPEYFRDEAHQPEHVRRFEEQRRGRQFSATPSGRSLSDQMRQARAALTGSWRWQARIFTNPEVNAAREVIRQQDDDALKRTASNATRRDSTKPEWRP